MRPANTLISSPARTSRDGFTLLPPILTCPALQASVASERLLKSRTPQSHLSMRTLVCTSGRVNGVVQDAISRASKTGRDKSLANLRKKEQKPARMSSDEFG